MVVLHVLAVVVVVQDNVVRVLLVVLVKITVPLDALLHVDNVLDVQVVVWEVVVLAVLVLVVVLVGVTVAVVSVTVDGNKELHDACRVFPDGRPSYDLAVAAAKDWMDKGGVMGSKITIAPGNVMHLYEALTHMVELGYDDINANCVYEKGWATTHAVVLYAEMKRVADYFLNTDLNFLDGSFRCSLYENRFFCPKEETDVQNWCGGNGVMLSVDPDGVFYPCIRYMESSLNGEQEPYMAQGYITPDGLKTFLEMGKLYEKAGGNDIYHEKLLPDIESLEVRYTKDNVL